MLRNNKSFARLTLNFTYNVFYILSTAIPFWLQKNIK